ncbi:MAG: sulfatase-like hydrolase/transferase, partial [Thermoguttaceae bacterium]
MKTRLKFVTFFCAIVYFFFAIAVQAQEVQAQEVRAQEAKKESPPNVVILLADDLGWGDLSIHKGITPTPSIDRLMQQGRQMRCFLTNPVCSPTRGALLTARHPLRLGAAPNTGGELAADETTIAEAFKSFGYATGVFGKWHNGDDPATPEFLAHFAETYPGRELKKGGLGVNEHGFDEAWVYYGGGADYFNRKTVQGNGPVSWWHNRELRVGDVGYT